MKIISVLSLAVLILSCAKKYVLHSEKILSVHTVFQDTLSRHWEGYRVKNELIRYDTKNNFVKEYLSRNLNNHDSFKKADNWSRILSRIENSKTQKYVPIKVTPLNEFGYIKLADNKVIFYGIMGSLAFIDLTNNKVYVK